MQRPLSAWLLPIALLILFFLHQDFWFWNDDQIVLGLPIGLTYHIIYCFACTLVFALAVHYRWPHFPATDDKGSQDA